MEPRPSHFAATRVLQAGADSWGRLALEVGSALPVRRLPADGYMYCLWCLLTVPAALQEDCHA